MEGKYTDSYLEREGADAPKVEADDMKVIASPLDFVGLNVYTPEYVRADSSRPATWLSIVKLPIREWLQRGWRLDPR
jgi:beta-glucosidase